MKAYLIARVSTDDQKDALPAQIYRLNDYAERQFTSSELFQFQESAFKEGRKQFAEIVERIKSETDLVTVVFDKIDRFSRDGGADEARALKKLCWAGKIELHFISDHLRLTVHSSANEWMMLGNGEVSAEYYSRSTSDNVCRKFEQMRRDGLWTGKAPFGYKNTTQGDKKWIEPDGFQAQVVQAAFRHYATGVSSLKLIRKQLKVEYGAKLSVSQIDRILHNPFYKGTMRIEGQLYAHNYERLITAKLFSRVEAVREGYAIKPSRYAGLPYTYRGLIYCAECGCRITFEQKKHKYVYGHCTQTRGKHTASYVQEAKLTTQLTATIKSFAIPEDALVKVSEELKRRHADDVKSKADKLAGLNAEIKKYELRLEVMYDDKLDGTISPELYDKKRLEFTKAKEILESRRKKLELMSKDDLDSVLHLLKLSQAAPKIFAEGKMERKRALVKKTHSNLELDGKLLRSELAFPFDKIAECNKTQNWLGLWSDFRTLTLAIDPVSMARVKALLV